MPGIRLRLVCSAQAVPDGQAKTIVGVMLGTMHGMVNPMHVGRDEHEAKPAINRLRQGKIGVIEECRGVEHDLEKDDRTGGRAKHIYRADFQDHRQGDFDRVKADGRGYVHVTIRVVYTVEPPEERYLVGEDMLPPDQEVEDQDSGKPFQPDRQGQAVEEADA